MKRVAFLFEILIACLSIAPACANHALTVDDILSMEDVGRAVIARDGRFLVYEWIPPYAKAPNLETIESTIDRSALAQLRVLDLERPSQSKPLFEQDVDGGYWLGGPSPDGAKLAVYSLIAGELKAGVFDFTTQRLSMFSFTPNYYSLVQRPVWISNDELVYQVLPPGRRPSIIHRSGLAAELNELWQKSFRGVEPSTTTIRSTVSGTEEADSFREGTLVRVNARSGKTLDLSRGYFYNLKLSRGRRHLAALKEGGHVQQLNLQAGDGISLARKQLIVVDLEVGTEVVPCVRCNVIPGTLNWSADDTRLTFFAREVGESVEEAELFQYQPANTSIEKVSSSSIRFACGSLIGSHFRAVGVGRGVAVFGRVIAESEDEQRLSPLGCNRKTRQDWFLLQANQEPVNLTNRFESVSGDAIGLAQSALFVLADGDMWRLDADGHRRNLTRNPKATLSPWGIGFDAAMRSTETLYTGDDIPVARTELQTDDEIIVADLRTGKIKVIDKPAPNAQLLAVANAADTAVFRHDSHAGSKLLLTQERRASRPILEFNQHLSTITEARRIQMTHDGPGGTQLSSCLLLPPDYAPNTRYPMVVHAYPNTTGECFSSELSTFNPFNRQLLTAQGYILLFAATPRSQIRTADGPTRGLTPVVLTAVDQAIREGYADPDRIGVMGFSQGSHSALQLITETHRFKAAIAMHGISDFISHYGTTPLAYRLSADSFGVGNAGRYESMRSDNGLGVKPWEDPSRYVRNSPIFLADKIQTPLLIMHSDFDIFPLGQSEEIFSALYRLRKEAEYVTYWGEGHGNMSPANIRDMWARIFRWLDEHLAVRTDDGAG